MWTVIRANRHSVTSQIIWMKTKLVKLTCAHYLRQLTRAGILAKTKAATTHSAAVYQLVEDHGFIAPRVNEQGQLITTVSTAQKIWTLMWPLKRFSVDDIMLHLNTDIDPTSSRDNVHRILSRFNSAGYISGNKKNGYSVRPARNTGPIAPVWQTVSRLYDCNLHKVVSPPHEADK